MKVMFSLNTLLYLIIGFVCLYERLDCAPLESGVTTSAHAPIDVTENLKTSVPLKETPNIELWNVETPDIDSGLETGESPVANIGLGNNDVIGNLATGSKHTDASENNVAELKKNPDDIVKEENNEMEGGEAAAQHGGYSKNSAPEYEKDSDGRDDSSLILHYAIPATAIALVVVSTALVIRCRTRREENRKKFGPGTQFELTDIFRNKKTRMKGFHRLSTESDSEEQSDDSVF